MPCREPVVWVAFRTPRIWTAIAWVSFAVGCRTGADGDPWANDESVRSGGERDDDGARDDERGDLSDDSEPSDTDEPVPDDAESGERDDESAADDESDEGDGSNGGDDVTDGDSSDDDSDSITDDAQPECEPSAEICDELDNDCDDEVDEGYICPADETILNPTPFDGGVYFVGTTAEGVAGAMALQRFWPSLHDSYVEGFGSSDRDLSLRRSDWQLFFRDTSKVYGRLDGEVPITGCSATKLTHYEFDASNTLHYQCGGTLYRGDGELVSDAGARLLGVTDDGRMAVHLSGGAFGFFDVDGELYVSDLFVSGSLSYESSRGVGDGVLAVYARSVPEPEQVVFEFDENSEWTVKRRIPTDLSPTSEVVALPDGTLFLVNAERIVGFMPDGTERVVWEETDDKVVRMHGERDLFVGPLGPDSILQ